MEKANSEDPEQTDPLGGVRFGSALFAQNYLSNNKSHYGKTCILCTILTFLLLLTS